MNYNEFISGINDGSIKQIKFYIKNYNHYRNCTIRSYIDIFVFRGRQVQIPTIECKLTEDGSELYRFTDQIKEDFKLFKMRGMTYTLKQIWDRIVITEIV